MPLVIMTPCPSQEGFPLTVVNLIIITSLPQKKPNPATLRMTVLISPGVVNQYPFTIQLLLAFP